MAFRPSSRIAIARFLAVSIEGMNTTAFLSGACSENCLAISRRSGAIRSATSPRSRSPPWPPARLILIPRMSIFSGIFFTIGRTR